MDLSELIELTERLKSNGVYHKVTGITIELKEEEAVLLRFSIKELVPNIEVNEAAPFIITHAGIDVTIITKR